MAATPRYKVYSADGRYMAACKEPEGAAVLMMLYGDGATVGTVLRLCWWWGC